MGISRLHLLPCLLTRLCKVNSLFLITLQPVLRGGLFLRGVDVGRFCQNHPPPPHTHTHTGKQGRFLPLLYGAAGIFYSPHPSPSFQKVEVSVSLQVEAWCQVFFHWLYFFARASISSNCSWELKRNSEMSSVEVSVGATMYLLKCSATTRTELRTMKIPQI